MNQKSYGRKLIYTRHSRASENPEPSIFLDPRFCGGDGASILIAFLGLTVLLAGCHRKEEVAKLEAFPVQVAVAEIRTLEERISVTGSLKARDEATLFPRVPGKLKANLLREGDRVQKNQPVALIERDEVGVVFEPAPVPSTLRGVVGRIYLDRGENVTLNTPVALVVDDSEILGKAEIPERYAGRVKVGQDVRITVDAHPGERLAGRVSRVSPVVDPATRSAPIEVKVDNASGRLRSGMFAELTVIVAKKEKVLAVPVAAVVEGSGASVFVVRDGQAAKREITIGIQTDDSVEVTSGLSSGEKIITSGLFALRDGSPVEISK
jgi:membrane fusion protein, multidrug efflux system